MQLYKEKEPTGQREMYGVERKGTTNKSQCHSQGWERGCRCKGGECCKEGKRPDLYWDTGRVLLGNPPPQKNKTTTIKPSQFVKGKDLKDFCASKKQQLAQLLQMWFTLARVHPKLAG